MKARNKGIFVIAFGLMALIARPQIMFAQTQPTPIKGSWDKVKAIPTGNNVVVRLRNGQTLSGTATRTAEELPSRTEALRTYTINGAWMSFDEADRGSLEPNKLADLAVLDRDYMAIPVEDIAKIQSVLTLVGGKVVYADAPYEDVVANK